MSSLHYLRWRKSTVQNQIQFNRNAVASTEDKLIRLRQALNELSSTLSDLDSVRYSINSLSIDLKSWRGKKEDDFEQKYNRYKDNTKAYVFKVDDAKEAINDDIRRYEAEKASYQSSISSLEHTIRFLDNQIAHVKRGVN
ncbi:YwqH-like family protein [Alkalihalobacillus hemicellulosilyticus]|uniref:Uncharacterized protein n=1 Tax=Halalkalibacter hemicellulosilyticusJCM 9152 TaxID=1236971 RepID=W4QKA0_9BACI|nr:DUF5082 family protein [Halalkalibacter hemicellulosilyticus]GAE32063.1 hypothetical protein JCM9152_3579 [Halalkalibacter hemicellulosilyticusJCM 9152]